MFSEWFSTINCGVNDVVAIEIGPGEEWHPNRSRDGFQPGRLVRRCHASQGRSGTFAGADETEELAAVVLQASGHGIEVRVAQPRIERRFEHIVVARDGSYGVDEPRAAAATTASDLGERGAHPSSESALVPGHPSADLQRKPVAAPAPQATELRHHRYRCPVTCRMGDGKDCLRTKVFSQVSSPFLNFFSSLNPVSHSSRLNANNWLKHRLPFLLRCFIYT